MKVNVSGRTDLRLSTGRRFETAGGEVDLDALGLSDTEQNELAARHWIEPVEPEVDATDAARELAEAEGIDLTAVEGTGADGRIVLGDVRALIDDED